MIPTKTYLSAAVWTASPARVTVATHLVLSVESTATANVYVMAAKLKAKQRARMKNFMMVDVMIVSYGNVDLIITIKKNGELVNHTVKAITAMVVTTNITNKGVCFSVDSCVGGCHHDYWNGLIVSNKGPQNSKLNSPVLTFK